MYWDESHTARQQGVWRVGSEQHKLNTTVHLPFASEMEEAQGSPATPGVDCVQPHAVPAVQPLTASQPSIFAQPKEKIIEFHAQSTRPAPQYAPVEITDCAQEEDQNSHKPEDALPVREERTLLGFLVGLLPGTSAPRTWRPVGTLVVMLLILFLSWHVVNGKDGISVWQQKRAEERRLQQEIDRLQQENAQIKTHIDELNANQDAIEREARVKLHYARPGEIIYTLPEKPAAPDAAR